jgi:arginase
VRARPARDSRTSAARARDAAGEIRQIGIRSVDEGEKRLVKEHGLDVYDMRYIDEVGMKRAMEEALEGVDADTHVHVSFDVDFLDPSIAPGVGHHRARRPELPRGAAGDGMIADSRRMGSLDIVELNPLLDAQQRHRPARGRPGRKPVRQVDLMRD